MKINIALISFLLCICNGEVFSQNVYSSAQKTGLEYYEKPTNTFSNFLQIKESERIYGTAMPVSDSTNLGNHLVFTDFLLLFFRQAAIGYEYINDEDKIGVRIPLTLGFGSNRDYKEVGVDVKFYITEPYSFYRKIGQYDAGDASVRYFLGPAFSGIFAGKDRIASLRFSNGVSMQFDRGINLTAHASVGPAVYFTDNTTEAISKGHAFVYWSLNGCIGWRFSK